MQPTSKTIDTPYVIIYDWNETSNGVVRQVSRSGVQSVYVCACVCVVYVLSEAPDCSPLRFGHWTRFSHIYRMVASTEFDTFSISFLHFLFKKFHFLLCFNNSFSFSWRYMILLEFTINCSVLSELVFRNLEMPNSFIGIGRISRNECNQWNITTFIFQMCVFCNIL